MQLTCAARRFLDGRYRLKTERFHKSLRRFISSLHGNNIHSVHNIIPELFQPIPIVVHVSYPAYKH